VADFFVPTMRLYLDKMVDWETLLRLRSGDAVDVEAEVGAYATVLETTAQLAESFQDECREKWAEEAHLTEDGGASSPPHLRRAYDQLAEAGLVSLPVTEAYGGYGLPALLNGAYLEMLSRADASLMMIVGLQSGAAGDIEKFGSEETKQKWLPRFASGEVEGCMDLTEPQAGSDLGGITTRVTEVDGKLLVDGQKIFISNGGGHVHLVLAREDETYEQSKGTTRGLSLILVARHKDDGSRNGMRVSRLERKLGIHGSATAEVVFEKAEGVLLGEKGEGFRAMLDLMNMARLGVASQALGLAEGAMHDAVSYAHERKQFGKPIVEQPLVLNKLAKMVVDTEAVRALLYRTYNLLDGCTARERALKRDDLTDTERSQLEKELERDSTRVRLLTPLCKYHATEACTHLTLDALQVHGGIGFTLDSDIGKLHNDSLIMTIYEGTSEIQASFALREMGKGSLAVVFGEVRAELEQMTEPKRVALAVRVREAIAHIEQTLGTLASDMGYALLRASVMAEMVIDVIAATELLKQAGVDPSRIDLAESFIRRRMLSVEHGARRIEANADARVALDQKVVARVAAE